MPPTPTTSPATSADAASFIESFRARLRDAVGNLVGHIDNFVVAAEGKVDDELSGLHDKLGEAHDIVNGILAEPVPANLKVPSAAPAPAPAASSSSSSSSSSASPSGAAASTVTEPPAAQQEQHNAINPGGS